MLVGTGGNGATAGCLDFNFLIFLCSHLAPCSLISPLSLAPLLCSWSVVVVIRRSNRTLLFEGPIEKLFLRDYSIDFTNI